MDVLSSLAVSGIPIVEIEKSAYSVEIGRTQNIKTTISKPGQTSYWEKIKNGTFTQIPYDRRTQVLNGNLIIQDCEEADAADYICSVKNCIRIGTKSQTTLDVTGKHIYWYS